MENLTTDTWKKLPVRNPIDSAFFRFAPHTDVKHPEEVLVNLNEFDSNSLSKERIKPVELITITTGKGEDEKENTFKNLKEANKFLRELAEKAPSAKEGVCEVLPVYIEWENKHEAAFKGFTMYESRVYLTNEMKQSAGILERSVALQDMFSAGLMFPKGISPQKMKENQEFRMYDEDMKDFLVTSLKHLEGVNTQMQDFTKQYENHKEISKDVSKDKPKMKPFSLKPRTTQKTVGKVGKREVSTNEHGMI